MKKTISILFFLFALHQLAYSQIKIVDEKTGEAISFAHLVIEGGKSGASSNIDGYIYLPDVEKNIKNPSSSITIQHIGYESIEMSWMELQQLQVIQLKERDIVLTDLVVTTANKYDFIVLKGYFRSYQSNDQELKYYTDGIVEYYFPKKGKKFQVNLIEHRSFRNQKLIDDEKRRAATILMTTAGIPYIDGVTIIDDLGKDYSISKSISGYDILKNKSKVGYIKTSKEIMQINIDKILPKKEQVHSLFGYTSRIQSIEITERYLSDSIQQIRIDDLESIKKYIKIFYSHKKDNTEVEIEGVHEFYVTERKYCTKKDMKKIKLSTFSGLRESSSYTHEYWKDLSTYSIPPLSTQIEEEIQKSLIPY